MIWPPLGWFVLFVEPGSVRHGMLNILRVRRAINIAPGAQAGEKAEPIRNWTTEPSPKTIVTRGASWVSIKLNIFSHVRLMGTCVRLSVIKPAKATTFSVTSFARKLLVVVLEFAAHGQILQCNNLPRISRMKHQPKSRTISHIKVNFVLNLSALKGQ